MMISNSPFDKIRAKRRTSPVFGIAVAAAVLVLFALVAVFRSPLTDLFWTLAGPVMSARYAADASDASLQALLADRESLYRENLDLKARLGRADVPAVRILGGVLLRPPTTPYDTLVIDAGRQEGVAEGDLVSAGGTALVGTVTELNERTARVTLFSAPGAAYDALLHGTIPVSVGGQGGGSLAGAVPAGTAVRAGDTALPPGLAGGGGSGR